MKVEDILKEKSIKVTKGRISILNILIKSEIALSAEEIYNTSKKLSVNINLSTVYRALEVFDEKKIVDKFILDNGVFMYKIKNDEHKHYLECDVCHKEVEVPCPMKQLETIVERDTGFTLTEHNLVLKGICNSCKDK